MTPEVDPAEDNGSAGSVTGQWVEVYSPDGEPAQNEPVPVPEPRGGLAAVLLFGVSLVLVALGSVLPLAQAVAFAHAPGTASQTLSVEAWEITILPPDTGESGSQSSPLPIGYPLLLAGLLLIAAVVLRVRAHRAATTVGVIAATFLSAMVLTAGVFAVAWQGFGTPDEGLSSSIGDGFWVLVVAAVVGIVAAAVRSGRGERAERDQPAPGE